MTLIAVGEAWLSKKEFARINKEREKSGEQLFANPRNAAAGSLRQLDPTVTRARKIETFVYDIEYLDEGMVPVPTTQKDELALLKDLDSIPTHTYNTARAYVRFKNTMTAGCRERKANSMEWMGW